MATRDHLKRLTVLLSCWSMSATAQTVYVPEGRIEWQCGQRWDDCKLVRKDQNGLPTITANPAEVGTIRSRLILSRDGKTVYSAGRDFASLDATTLNSRWIIRSKEGETFQSILAESQDGQTLALSLTGYSKTARQNWGNVQLFRADTGETLRTIKHPGPPPAEDWLRYYRTVTALAFAPDQGALAVGSTGGGIRIIQLNTAQETTLQGACGQSRATAHAGAVRDLMWSANNQLVSTANDGTVRLWDTASFHQTACLHVLQGGWKLYPLSGSQLLVENATTFTLINLAGFKKVTELGPTVSAVQDIQISPARVTLVTEGAEQAYALPSGELLMVNGPDLASLQQGNVQVTVRPDMQVTMTQNGKTSILNARAIPPEHYRSRNPRWNLMLKGQQLQVNVTSYVRVMTMEGDDFQNRYVWNLKTGRLESCETWQMGLMYSAAPQKSEPDDACKTALQHGQGRQNVETIWHK